MKKVLFTTVLWDAITEAQGDMTTKRNGLRIIKTSKAVNLSNICIEGICHVEVDRNYLTLFVRSVPIASCDMGNADSVEQFNEALYEFASLPSEAKKAKTDTLSAINGILEQQLAVDPAFEDAEFRTLDLSSFGVTGALCQVSRNGGIYSICQGPVRIAGAYEFGSNVMGSLDYGIWWWLQLGQARRDEIINAGISPFEALPYIERTYECTLINNRLKDRVLS